MTKTQAAKLTGKVAQFRSKFYDETFSGVIICQDRFNVNIEIDNRVEQFDKADLEITAS